MTAICLNLSVSGRVQGVFYRRFCVDQANDLGVTGWVKNLSDGGVELLICGEKEVLDKMIAKLWEGPPRAVVEDIRAQAVPYQSFNYFEVKN